MTLGSQEVDPGPIRSKDNGLVIYNRDTNISDGDLQISLDLAVMKFFNNELSTDIEL